MSIDNAQTQKDASALARLLSAMFGTGPDGIEAGFGTSEFWLTVAALGLDVAGPHFGILKTLTPDTQLAVAGFLASAYTYLRSWRKKAATAPVAPAPATTPTPAVTPAT